VQIFDYKVFTRIHLKINNISPRNAPIVGSLMYQVHQVNMQTHEVEEKGQGAVWLG